MTRECAICGHSFEPNNPKRPALTCSRACRNKLQWQRVPVRAKSGPPPKPRVIADCAWCGKPVKWAQRPGRQGKYCSRSCVGKSHSTGGVQFSEGRWKVRLRDGASQLYSRCLMEAHLGRHLTYDEIVHHINGDRTDDRIENLALVDRRTHLEIHREEINERIKASSAAHGWGRGRSVLKAQSR